MQDVSDVYDVIIIGGGPAGVTAAQYASRAKLGTVILDKSATAGALAYSSKIENYPGITKPVSGKELHDTMRIQAVGFGAEYMETQVVGVNLSGDIKEVITMDRTYFGKTIIIATGSMGRKPTIKGEGEFLGRGVSYCAICDAAFFKERCITYGTVANSPSKKFTLTLYSRLSSHRARSYNYCFTEICPIHGDYFFYIP